MIKGRVNDYNVGKVVRLIEHIPVAQDSNGDIFHDLWDCFSEDGLHHSGGKISKQVCFEASRLIPIGDKQTQDELLRESELERV